MTTDHDGIYKELFSHPCLVADLLAHFAPGNWAELSPVVSLTRRNGSFVCDDGAQRHTDMAWQIGADSERCYVLLEFQSAPDPSMALRMLAYSALLYQDLLKSGDVGSESTLPPLLPLVLYNGRQPWNASRQVRDLIQELPSCLGKFRPAQCHALIDVHRLDPAALAQTDSAVAAIFHAEVTGRSFEFLKALTILDEWSMREPGCRGLASTAWARYHAARVLGWNLDAAAFPEEVNTMFNGELYRYVDNAKKEAHELGLREGRVEGLREGRMEGQRALLKLIFEKRLGDVSGALAEQIDNASPEEVERLILSLATRHIKK
jgi:predicted transposase YdaD